MHRMQHCLELLTTTWFQGVDWTPYDIATKRHKKRKKNARDAHFECTIAWCIYRVAIRAASQPCGPPKLGHQSLHKSISGIANIMA